MLETTNPPAVPQSYPLEFRGNGKEYFKIWVVNIGLTILTLGIYSAWAKVRTRRYFYNHLYLNGQTFDYHADPIKILKGRLLIGAIIFSFSLAAFSSVFLFIPLIFFALFPYLLVRGAIFNFTNTSYRGVRFAFERNYQGSYMAALKAFLVTILTLGLGVVATNFIWKKFIADNAALGRSRFKMGGSARGFWGTVMKEPILYGIGFFILMMGVLGVGYATGLFSKEDLGKDPEGIGLVIGYSIVAVQYLFYGFLFVIFTVRSANYYAEHLGAQGVERFESKLTLWDTLMFYAEHFFLLIITLGLAWPWVQVAIMKFKSEHFAVLAQPEFFTALEQAKIENASAFGEEVASFWDFDIGF